MSQVGNKIHVVINNYEIDSSFPKYYYGDTIQPNQATIRYGDNIGCFGAYNFQIFVPDKEAILQSNSNYYLELKDYNFNAKSISNVTTTEQRNVKDDIQ